MIKLPRRRKKKFIKEFGYQTYITQKIICEILYEENPVRENMSFYKYKVEGWKVLILKRY